MERLPIRWSRMGLALLVVVSLAGCSSDVEVGGERDAPSPASGIVATPDAEGIEVETVSAEQFERAIAAHQGDVVLVDFWATWCVPCTEQFPHTVELSRKYADKGLRVITMSLDDPGDKERVTAFLRENNATTENYLSELGAGTASVEAFDLDAGVPHYRIYDRQGELRHRFDGDPREQDFDHKIEELL